MTFGRKTSITSLLAASVMVLIAVAWLRYFRAEEVGPPPPLQIGADDAGIKLQGQVEIAGGIYLVGNARGPRDVRPASQVELSPFSIDRTEVTNAMFAQFVEATGYLTDAERSGQSLVFDLQKQTFHMQQGACWQQPAGPGSTIVGKEQHPVVHVTWFDAQAYARWANKGLPTEFQWEAAARGKSLRQDYPWPETAETTARPLANVWEGTFPEFDAANDGFSSTSPVASFAGSENGLFDISGNVAEWTASWYSPDSYDQVQREDPTGPSQGQQRVVRGGSWISSDQTGTSEAMIWYRGKLDPAQSNNFTGFRCVANAAPLK